jgi:hypothetical protein
MIGLVDRERVDAQLYDDYETAKAREVCVCVCVLGSILNSDIGFWQFVEIKLFVVCFELRRKDWRRKLVLKKCKRRMLLLGRK